MLKTAFAVNTALDDPPTFNVEVDWTDRTRHPDGHFTTFTHYVTVMAKDEHEATHAAFWMVSNELHPDDMIIATRITGVSEI